MLGAIIQARMGSSRLPGKVLKKVDGKHPMLYYLLDQIQYCKFHDNIVVATSCLKEDDPIEHYLNTQTVTCFRGSSDDVLDRYYNCAKKFNFDPIVRLTADNPLIDPQIIDLVIKNYETNSVDYVSNARPRTYPYGTEVEIFSFNTLEIMWNKAKKPSEREHVTPYIHNNPDKFKIRNVEYSKNISHFRWTVDKENDLQLIMKIISKIKKSPILMEDILNLYSNEKELFNINKNNIPDEEFLKSLKEDEDFKKRV